MHQTITHFSVFMNWCHLTHYGLVTPYGITHLQAILIQVMTCHLLGVDPLPKPNLTYQLSPQEQTFVRFGQSIFIQRNTLGDVASNMLVILKLRFQSIKVSYYSFLPIYMPRCHSEKAPIAFHEAMREFNSLAPVRFEWNFRYLISQIILVKIVLKWMPMGLTDGKSTSVQAMAWCHQATSHYLSQCWPRSLSPYDVTRPQWVNIYISIHFHYLNLTHDYHVTTTLWQEINIFNGNCI